MKKHILVILTFFALLAMGLTSPLQAEQVDEVTTEQVATKPMIVAKVNGLVCDFCAQALKKVFKKQDAVASLDVNMDKGEVSIILKPGKNLAEKTLKTLITDSGYSYVSSERIGGA